MTNVCLNFDDGYYDFYARVYPLLKKHDLRALLAVAPHFLRDYIDGKPGDRLALEGDAAFANPARGGFCTWSELEEMTASGHVTIAAHGYSRRRLDQPDADIQLEIDSPQRIIAGRVAQPVDSFVFPDGRCSPRSLHAARQRYRFVFGNGGASNRDWNQPVIYRIDADGMASPLAPFSMRRRVLYRARYWWNCLRASRSFRLASETRAAGVAQIDQSHGSTEGAALRPY